MHFCVSIWLLDLSNHFFWLRCPKTHGCIFGQMAPLQHIYYKWQTVLRLMFVLLVMNIKCFQSNKVYLVDTPRFIVSTDTSFSKYCIINYNLIINKLYMRILKWNLSLNLFRFSQRLRNFYRIAITYYI